MLKNYKEDLKHITSFVFDVDGVLTDSSILITSKGESLRKMSVRDGFALKTAVNKGYGIAVISGGTNEGVRERLKELGITDIYLGVQQKEEQLKAHLELYGLEPNQVLYMGDDLPDIPAMRLVALPCCPQNAAKEVKAMCRYISHKHGGEGCVRDIIEQVLKVRGDWNYPMPN